MSPAQNNSTSSAGSGDIPDLNRVTFFDGQRLNAGDLNEASTVQRELRWLHNRSLHSWGIGLGFAVIGAKGARQVQIAPGYAIDCLGREIILTETITKPVPARSSDANGAAVIFYLVAAYPDENNLTVLERRDGDCDTNGAVRLQERAAIYWKEGSDAINGGYEIVLAQAKVKDCQLDARLSLDQRRSARPSQQPFVAAGATELGSTAWEAWTGDTADKILGIKTTVDTSDARFGSTPNYQAQVQGIRLGTNATDFPVIQQFENRLTRYAADGSAFVQDATYNNFTLYMLMPPDLVVFGTADSGLYLNPRGLFANAGEKLLLLAQANWYVVWVGVEGQG